MDELVYQVVVRTPEGIRIGELTAFAENEIIKGRISFPSLNGQYNGTIRPSGRINIVLHTVLDSVSVESVGEGQISFYAIHVSLLHNGLTYEIDGTVKNMKG